MNSDSENRERYRDPLRTPCPRPNSNAEQSQKSVVLHTPVILLTKKIRRKKRFSFSVRTLIVPAAALILSLFVLTGALERALTEQVRPLSEAETTRLLVEGIHQAIASLVADGSFSCEELVEVRRDENGRITDLAVDTTRLANLRVALTDALRNTGAAQRTVSVSVPLGNLFGWNLFSDVGIPVRVKTRPVGQAEVEVRSRLEDCGINQVRHTISADVRLQVRLVLPSDIMDSTVETSVPISERILMGEVPDSYWDGSVRQGS